MNFETRFTEIEGLSTGVGKNRYENRIWNHLFLSLTHSVPADLSGDLSAEDIRGALSHRPTEFKLTWTNKSKDPVILRDSRPVAANEECRIDWTRVGTVGPGARVMLPVKCTFGTYGDSETHQRLKTIELAALSTRMKEIRRDSVTLRTLVYPGSHYTEETDTCTRRPKKCRIQPFQPRARLCFVDAKDADQLGVTRATVIALEKGN